MKSFVSFITIFYILDPDGLAISMKNIIVS